LRTSVVKRCCDRLPRRFWKQWVDEKGFLDKVLCRSIKLWGLEQRRPLPLSFGANLRRERELRGISLDEISRETKISVRFLEAIERDQFDLLPGGVFRKGFVKTYARYLGLHEEKVLQDYALQGGGSEPEPAAEEVHPFKKPAEVSAPSWSLKVTLGLLLLILLLVVSLWYLRHTSTRNAAGPKPVAPLSSRQEAATLPPSPAKTSGSPSLPSPSETVSPPELASAVPPQTGPPSVVGQANPKLKVLGELAKKPEGISSGSVDSSPTGILPGQLALKVNVVNETWMSVEAEQKTVYSGLLYPAQAKTFVLDRPLKVTLGNAGGVRFSVNNRSFVSLGRSGEVRVVMISPENYLQFLAPADQTER
jgi:cytoskeleton protein RodZ